MTSPTSQLLAFYALYHEQSRRWLTDPEARYRDVEEDRDELLEGVIQAEIGDLAERVVARLASLGQSAPTIHEVGQYISNLIAEEQ